MVGEGDKEHTGVWERWNGFICSQELPLADHAREERGIVVEVACRVQPRPNVARLLQADAIVVSGEADEPEMVSMLDIASFHVFCSCRRG